jgi:hypothetical protein
MAMRIVAILLLAIGLLGSTDAPLPPCPTEDSVGCYWDASARGNGVGQSFTVDAEGQVTYLP